MTDPQEGRKEGRRGETGQEKKDDKPLAPEFETIPAGPVYAFITHSDATAPVNALMQKRAFQISEYTFTSLPQKAEDVRARAAAGHAGRNDAARDDEARDGAEEALMDLGRAGACRHAVARRP